MTKDKENTVEQLLAERNKKLPTKQEQQEADRRLKLSLEFSALPDKEKLLKFIELDQFARNVAAALDVNRRQHQAELLTQSKGRTVDAMTKFMMDRREREHGYVTSRAQRLEAALREAVRTEGDTERGKQWAALLAENPPKKAPTPGKALFSFRPMPMKPTMSDVMLVLKDTFKEFGVDVPDVVEIVVERAFASEPTSPAQP